MNTSLPNTNKKGFTLIELLVVISIIAIISVVGIAIFQGQQRGARDARRMADIESIAQAMEAQKVTGSATYNALSATFFSSGVIPTDPTNTNTTPDSACGGATNGGVCKYCVRPAGAGACTVALTAVGPAQPPVGATWTVCANLEQAVNGNTFFCRSNSQ